MTLAQNELSVGTVVAATYKIVARLGQGAGGMAQIYLATCENGGQAQQVVLKIANLPNRAGAYYTEALRNEVGYLRRFHHPNLIQLFPMAGEAVQTPYYLAQHQPPKGPYFAVLEYLAHGSVADLLAANPQGLPLAVALDISYMLATVIHYLHGYGLVHMDIKPRNAMLRQPFTAKVAGEAVLIDLGSARPAGEQETELASTFRISAYLAPEWLEAAHRGRLLAQPSLDVYALGVLFYHMLTGKPPFAGETPRELEAAIRGGKWRSLADVWQVTPNPVPAMRPPLLDDLFRNLLSGRAEQRYTAGMLAEHLAEVRFFVQKVAAENKQRRLVSPIHKWQQPRSRGRVAALAKPTFLLLAGIGMGGMGHAWYSNSVPPLTQPPSQTSITSTPTDWLVTPTPTVTPTASATSTVTPTDTATPQPTATILPTATVAPSATAPPGPTVPSLAPLAPTVTDTPTPTRRP